MAGYLNLHNTTLEMETLKSRIAEEVVPKVIEAIAILRMYRKRTCASASLCPPPLYGSPWFRHIAYVVRGMPLRAYVNDKSLRHVNDKSFAIANNLSITLVNDKSFPLANDLSFPDGNDKSFAIANDLSLAFGNELSFPLQIICQRKPHTG